jgi:hypothetical protein
MAEPTSLLAAWNGGEPVARTLVVPTHVGDVEVSLRVPYESETTGEDKPPYDVLADLFELGQQWDAIDAEARGPLEAELVRRFAASPEASSLPQVHWCRCLMDLGANYLGATVATLDASQLREVVFEIIPRKVSIEAQAAGEIIAELRAFYGFLGRAFGLKQASACLRVLGGDASTRLHTALSDTSQFGMAKSMFMAGHAAGFGTTSKEGIEAWMRVMQSQPLPASVRLPSFGPALPAVTRTAARAKKSARKAHKKNR